jgi:large subunit ribosomal protein L6
MSRIGKQPIAIPSGVEVTIGKDMINVKGPKGALGTPAHEKILVAKEGDHLVLTRADDSRTARAQHGCAHAAVQLRAGRDQGLREGARSRGRGLQGPGQGKNVVLTVGFSHPVEFPLPAGVEAKAEGNKLTLTGIDKQAVGEVAAQIRRVRPPEPFKGKGIKYADETIRRKAGKSGAKK